MCAFLKQLNIIICVLLQLRMYDRYSLVLYTRRKTITKNYFIHRDITFNETTQMNLAQLFHNFHYIIVFACHIFIATHLDWQGTNVKNIQRCIQLRLLIANINVKSKNAKCIIISFYISNIRWIIGKTMCIYVIQYKICQTFKCHIAYLNGYL